MSHLLLLEYLTFPRSAVNIALFWAWMNACCWGGSGALMTTGYGFSSDGWYGKNCKGWGVVPHSPMRTFS